MFVFLSFGKLVGVDMPYVLVANWDFRNMVLQRIRDEDELNYLRIFQFQLFL